VEHPALVHIHRPPVRIVRQRVIRQHDVQHVPRLPAAPRQVNHVPGLVVVLIGRDRQPVFGGRRSKRHRGRPRCGPLGNRLGKVVAAGEGEGDGKGQQEGTAHRDFSSGDLGPGTRRRQETHLRQPGRLGETRGFADRPHDRGAVFLYFSFVEVLSTLTVIHRPTLFAPE
jgi:hypothetical protein